MALTDNPLLSVLIPSLETRKHYLTHLLDLLQPQQCQAVEVLTDVDNGENSIGFKRNRLLNRCKGSFVAFIDDDDEVSPTYLKSLLGAITAQPEPPDLVTFMLELYYDGRLITIKHSKLNLHLSPIRRAIALANPFPDCNSGEDTIWARSFSQEGLRTIHLNKVLYLYKQRSDHNRVGEITNQMRRDSVKSS